MQDNSGVCSHSTLTAQQEWAIFETHLPQTCEYWLRAKGISHKVLSARIKGAHKASFLVPASEVEVIALLDTEILQHATTCLYLNTCNARGKRPAWRINLDTMAETYLGIFQETQLGPNEDQDYWYDARTGRYFIIAPNFNASDVPLTPFTKAELEAYFAYRQRVGALP